MDRAAGWLLTIAVVSLGAPFWFDLLGKVVHLRGAGASRRLQTARVGMSRTAIVKLADHAQGPS